MPDGIFPFHPLPIAKGSLHLTWKSFINSFSSSLSTEKFESLRNHQSLAEPIWGVSVFKVNIYAGMVFINRKYSHHTQAQTSFLQKQESQSTVSRKWCSSILLDKANELELSYNWTFCLHWDFSSSLWTWSSQQSLNVYAGYRLKQDQWKELWRKEGQKALGGVSGTYSANLFLHGNREPQKFESNHHFLSFAH